MARYFTLGGIFAATLLLGSVALWGQTQGKPIGQKRLGKQTSSKRAEAVSTNTAEGNEFFEKRIRPLLIENCYQCHAKSNNMALGGLQLDSRAALLKGGNHGTVLSLSNPTKSQLLKAVTYRDNALKMPPKGKLSDEQISSLTTWVKMGAPWPKGESSRPPLIAKFDLKERAKHWSFQPVQKPALPAVKERTWVRTPVDNFVLAKLEANGLKPSPPADKRTLLRRVTFDLIGLPPTPPEVEAFLADNAPNAYEKVVERLLASPHYGERWARHWLDLVRFAETDGHEFDFDKPEAYQYRDYVIRAFNADVPYNQFVQEHLAGDLLPHPRLHPTEHTNESVIGTGFWWLGEGKHSPVDLEVDEAERIDNQVDVLSKSLLGLSVGCARCHDHKFDPISQKDYYALCGYMKSSRFHQANLSPTPNASLQQNLLTANRELVQACVQQVTTALSQPLNLTQDVKWKAPIQQAMKNPADVLYPWAALSASVGSSSPEAFIRRRSELLTELRELRERANLAEKNFTYFEDFAKNPTFASWYVTGNAFQRDAQRDLNAHLTAESFPRLTSLLPSGVADSGGVSEELEGTLRSKTFLLSKPFVLYRMAGRGAQVNLIIDGFQRIRYPIYGGLTIGINTDQMQWQGMEVSKWVGHRAYIEFLDSGPGYFAVDKIAFSDTPPPPHAPNPFVVQMLADPTVVSLSTLAQKYDNLLQETATQWQQAKPNAMNHLELVNSLLHTKTLALTPESGLATALQRKTTLEAQLPAPKMVMAMADGTGVEDRLHIRGNPKTLGEAVPRRCLTAFVGDNPPAPPTDGSGRLELAERLTSPSNPLLARVFVNRIWRHHFGEGIVRSPDDFGIMGERPTHPELLDWLASRFVAQEWSLKSLHRLLVLSNTYRMESRAEAQAEEKDPQNKLMHRMPIQRLEAESIRDAMLVVSGRLDRTLYGPSIMPYLTPFMEGRGRPASTGPLDSKGRRSIYISVRRNFLIPLFLAFDYPVPFTAIGRRTVSNVPAQALALMNNPFVLQQAEVWAKRVLAEPGQDAKTSLHTLYLTAFGRPPTETELTAALAFLAQQDKTYGNENDLHSWTDLCHVLMNVKEFIFVN